MNAARHAARSEAVAVASQIARSVARRCAPQVDQEERFPTEAVEALRQAGLLGLLVPAAAGGMGGKFHESCEIGIELGAECLSTALIWAMHSQQVAIMADHAGGQWGGVLAEIAAEGVLVASATTEPGKGGGLLLASAPLQVEGAGFRVERPSPVVSYGAEAGHYLVTMRRSPTSAETDVCFVLLAKGAGTVTGGWNAMGMRGTQSVAMHFDAVVPHGSVLEAGFRFVVTATAIPAAHLGWTSTWYGAARGALDRFVALLRSDPQERRRFASDLFCTRLADIRLSLDLLGSMLFRLIDRYEAMRAEGAPPEAYEDPEWTVPLNGLKVAGSRIAGEAASSLVNLAGFARGYLRDDGLGLERVFRDLRSAALMVSNDHLLQLNAKQILLHSREKP